MKANIFCLIPKFRKKGFWIHLLSYWACPGGSDRKESTCNVGDLGLIPGWGRSFEGGHGNPLQYLCLENPHGQRNLAGYSPCGISLTFLVSWEWMINFVKYSLYIYWYDYLVFLFSLLITKHVDEHRVLSNLAFLWYISVGQMYFILYIGRFGTIFAKDVCIYIYKMHWFVSSSYSFYGWYQCNAFIFCKSLYRGIYFFLKCLVEFIISSAAT